VAGDGRRSSMPPTKIIRRLTAAAELGNHPCRAGAVVLPRFGVKDFHLRDQIGLTGLPLVAQPRREAAWWPTGSRVITQSGHI
jgi:hypothetical protein